MSLKEAPLLSDFLGTQKVLPMRNGGFGMNTELGGALTADSSASRNAKSKRRAELRSPGQYVIRAVVSLFQFCMVV